MSTVAPFERLSLGCAILFAAALVDVTCAATVLTEEDFNRAGQVNGPDPDAVILTEEDFARGQSLSSGDLYKYGDKGLFPQKDKFHGDIVGKAAHSAKAGEQVSRNGIRLNSDKWPGGVVPYLLSNRYNQRERAVLARAFQAYHERTCIKFVPRNNEVDYLYIGKIDGCFSDVGKAGGRQELSLDDGCMEYDTVVHELMHAVGFWHEHERWDRDDFISILWQNIDRDAYDQFGKVNLYESDYYGELYDFYSVMHYDSKSFSRNGRNTIEAKQPGMTQVIGRVKDFSPVDLRKINRMYNCPNAPVQVPQVPQVPVAPQVPVVPQVPVTSAPTGQCRDRATLCWQWKERCRSPFFESIMRQYCEQTCGFCNTG